MTYLKLRASSLETYHSASVFFSYLLQTLTMPHTKFGLDWPCRWRVISVFIPALQDVRLHAETHAEGQQYSLSCSAKRDATKKTKKRKKTKKTNDLKTVPADMISIVNRAPK